MSAFDEDSTDASSFLLRRVNYERTNKLPYHSRSFKLDRMRRLLELLGDPHESLPVVHIAGTKGKGSTATMVASVLKNAGYRTGLYTSPHLMGVEERMRINGVPCPAIRLAELVDQVRPIVEQLDREAAEIGRAGDGPTYFEITTALAMLHFVQQSVDIAVLEVGLGGRLDSTNICRPLVSVITTIGFDHMAQLGNTLTAIAGEKAGIIKPGVPVVSGVTDREPRQVIQRVAVENGCKLIEAGVDFHFTYEPPPLFNHGLAHPRVGYRDGYTQIADVESNLLGRHQAANAANAIAALGTLRNSGWTIPESAIRIGVAQAECPARIEMVSRNPTIVLDAAHNACSIEALVETLLENCPPQRRTLVFASSRDKDIAAMLKLLVPHFQEIYFTRYVKNPRSAEPSALAEIARQIIQSELIESASRARLHVVEDPCAAWRTAFGQLQPDELLCVTGSFFLAAELRDPIVRDCRASAMSLPA